MIGTAKETTICGKTVRLRDWVRVRYMTGERMRGGEVEGEVVELWDPELDHHHQARVSSGWCFHDCDRILVHRRGEE